MKINYDIHHNKLLVATTQNLTSACLEARDRAINGVDGVYTATRCEDGHGVELVARYTRSRAGVKAWVR
jgi:hypothetical protein